MPLSPIGVPRTKTPGAVPNFVVPPPVPNLYAPPSIMGRVVAMAGIAAAWSLVLAAPVFATVGLQTQSDNPPPKTYTNQAIVRMWEPPTWDTQVTRKAPIPLSVSQAPFSRAAYQSLTAWDTSTVLPLWQTVGLQTQVDTPQPKTDKQYASVRIWEPTTWDTQVTRKAPIPDRHDAAPFFRPLLVDRWPQPEWDTQQTRKTPIPNRYDWVQRSLESARPITLWPQPEWPSQTTPKSPIATAATQTPFSRPAYQVLTAWDASTVLPLWKTVGYQTQVDAPLPKTDKQQGVVSLWPTPDWPSQTSRKSPIPDVVVVTTTPFSRLAASPISTWPQPDWDTQRTRKTPIPDRHDAAAFSRPAYQALTAWDTTTILPLWSTVGTQDGPTVGPSDNPPPDKRTWMSNVQQTWEPRPLQAVWFNILIDLSVRPHDKRLWMPTVQEAWQPGPWDTQYTRKAPIPDRHDAPPFRQRPWLLPVVQTWETGPPVPMRYAVNTPGVPTPNLGLLFYDVDTGVWYMRLNATTHEIIRIT